MSGAEQVKARSNRLRGTLSDELLEDTRVFSDDAEVILKFHGVYQQDDRDLRKEARKLGLDKHHMMMIRTRIPGGIVTPEAYLAHDHIAGAWGNGTLRITTRQDLQLHGVLKGDLKQSIRAINDALLTTLGGCGDQERNIMCCPAPWHDRLQSEIDSALAALVTGLTPTTRVQRDLARRRAGRIESARSAGHPLWGTLPAAQVQDRDRHRGRQLRGHVRERPRARGPCRRRWQPGWIRPAGGRRPRSHRKQANTWPAVAEPLGYVQPQHVVEAARAVVASRATTEIGAIDGTRA